MLPRAAIATWVLFMAFVAPRTVTAQEFEAATVKPVPPGTEYGGMRGGPGTSSPGQIHYEAVTLRGVMARAYGVQRFQISGPPWFDDVRYDIMAKVPPGTTVAQLQVMLQKLLAERFRLAFHRENRLLTAYELTVGKSGHKLKAAELPSTPAAPSGDSSPARSGLSLSGARDKVEMHGRRATLRQLLIWLSEETERDILDKTELTGAYDFDLTWTPSEEVGAAAILDAALEKQLGLKVTSKKTNVEMLVIDRLDRTPSAN